MLATAYLAKMRMRPAVRRLFDAVARQKLHARLRAKLDRIENARRWRDERLQDMRAAEAWYRLWAYPYHDRRSNRVRWPRNAWIRT